MFPIGNGEKVKSPTRNGFTLIELLVVMAIIATLLTLVAPRYFQSVSHSKEAVLKQNLTQVRDAIDKHYADKGKYPDSLEELVKQKYLRKEPIDPITESTTTWTVIAPEDSAQGAVYDIKSGAQGKASDGSAYSDW